MKIYNRYSICTKRLKILSKTLLTLTLLFLILDLSNEIRIEKLDNANSNNRSDVKKEFENNNNKKTTSNNDSDKSSKNNSDTKDIMKTSESHIPTIDRRANDDCKVSSVNIPEGSDSPIMVFKARIEVDEYTFISLKKSDLDKYSVKGEIIHTDKNKDLIWYKNDEKTVDFKSHRIKDVFNLCRRINSEYLETGNIEESFIHNDLPNKLGHRISKNLPDGISLKSI
jgi:hypothetical protein